MRVSRFIFSSFSVERPIAIDSARRKMFLFLFLLFFVHKKWLAQRFIGARNAYYGGRVEATCERWSHRKRWKKNGVVATQRFVIAPRQIRLLKVAKRLLNFLPRHGEFHAGLRNARKSRLAVPPIRPGFGFASQPCGKLLQSTDGDTPVSVSNYTACSKATKRPDSNEHRLGGHDGSRSPRPRPFREANDGGRRGENIVSGGKGWLRAG